MSTTSTSNSTSMSTPTLPTSITSTSITSPSTSISIIVKSERLTLDKLPVEIIRKIASAGTCKATLALSRVSKYIRAVCHDHLVYKAIIDNRNGSGEPKWQHNLPLSIHSPVSSWARYALADFRAPHGRLEDYKSCAWAPQLAAYHHPFINNHDDVFPFPFGGNICQLICPPKSYHINASVFCLALELMSNLPTNAGEPSNAGELTNAGEPTNVGESESKEFSSISGYLALFEKELRMFHNDGFYAVDSPGLMQKRIMALVTAGLLSVLLRAAKHWKPIKHLEILEELPVMATPAPTAIPFGAMMDLPLPFSKGAVMKKLSSCHLAKMTTAEFLQDGEWSGVSSQHHWSDTAQAMPMHGIRFTAASAEEGNPDVLHVRGTVMNPEGPFDLEGRVVQTTGQTDMRSIFAAPSRLEWRCLMTPLGIIGTWGHRPCGGFGLVWVWKNSWCADEGVQDIG